jgi:hypothetical protein
MDTRASARCSGGLSLLIFAGENSGARRAFAQTCLQASHFKGTGSRGVAQAGEVKNAVENIGQKFITEAEAVALA